MNDNTLKIIEVDINDILPNRFQPRIQFDEDEILELSDSIKEHGVIQPIVVRTIGDKYEIIAGERRYKASVLAGKETVPVLVRNLSDKESAEVALIENVQRKNLTPIEEAISYKKILDMGYLTQEDLANKLGKSQSSVANKIRLLNLSDEVQEALLENKISERHARSLLRLATVKEQDEMLDRIISERLTVRALDSEIDKLKNNKNDERKGENNMNNNIEMPTFNTLGNVQPTVSQTPTQPNPEIPTFNMFGNSATVAPTPMTPNTQVQPQTTTVPSFDVFGSAPQVQPTVPQAPVQPTISVEPTPSISTPNSNFQFDSNGTVVGVGTNENLTPEPQVQPTIQQVSTQPTFEFPKEQPQDLNSDINSHSSFPTFDIFGGNTPAQPIQNTNNYSSEPQPTIPVTAPIIEQPQTTVTQESENLFSFGPTSIEPQVQPTVPQTPSTPAVQEQPQQPSTEEFKMPDPIIITDYNKQYDPVMPQTEPTPTVDFKEVIAAIRECSNKIEQYGFKIDVEEYDLANLYQVVFKIEK